MEQNRLYECVHTIGFDGTSHDKQAEDQDRHLMYGRWLLFLLWYCKL